MAPPEPLRPAGRIEEVDADDVAAVLGPGGRLAAALAEYEDRAGQREMAQAVADTLNRRDHLLVEAGTGTGKSLAYLVPAVLYAVANGRRVVVSTNTINLQMQLHEKDVPLLQQTLPQPFRAAVAKGRSNYLCLRRWRAFLRDATHGKEELFFATRILFWLRETHTGDRQELALADEELGAWAQVAADADSCTPQLCRYHRQGVCFLARARRQAEAAHVVIVNHALLLADIALENQVLPAYDDLIIDEAHHLEEEATDQLGLRLEQHALLGLLQRLSLKIGQGRYGGLFGDIHSLLLVTGGADAAGARRRVHAAGARCRRGGGAAGPQPVRCGAELCPRGCRVRAWQWGCDRSIRPAVGGPPAAADTGQPPDGSLGAGGGGVGGAGRGAGGLGAGDEPAARRPGRLPRCERGA